MSLSILIVEDEALVALALEDKLREHGFDVVGVADRPAAALEIARRRAPALALVDVRLAGGGDGIALAASLAALPSPPVVLFATGNPAEVRARAQPGTYCLVKPFEPGWVPVAIEAARTGTPCALPNFFAL